MGFVFATPAIILNALILTTYGWERYPKIIGIESTKEGTTINPPPIALTDTRLMLQILCIERLGRLGPEFAESALVFGEGKRIKTRK